MIEKLILAIGLFLISIFISIQATASNLTNIYAFGDSLSDTGNLFSVTGSPVYPYYRGRVSNGQVWLEYLTQKLGLTDNKLTNFAFSGATSGTINLNGSDSKLLGLQQQVDYHVSFLKKNQRVADSKALYIIWIAANDYIPYSSVDYAAIHFKPSNEPTIPINNIMTTVNKLAGVGVKKIMVVNLPDLGKTPLTKQTENTTFLSQLTAKHNYQLSTTLNNIKSSTDTKILLFDINSLFKEVLNNPKKFNFKNVTDACLEYDKKDTAIICSNPDEYLFWDGVHPTTAAHKIIGESAYRQIDRWIK